jgi:hypothetical protein
VDGRVLASLQRKDLEKHLGITKRHQQLSLLAGIELLRKYEFDVDLVSRVRATYQCHMQQQPPPLDITLWTNEHLVEWLQMVNLKQYSDTMCESGIHGALLANADTFTVDILYQCLGANGDEQRLQMMKKILEDELKLLRKIKNPNCAYAVALKQQQHQQQQSKSPFVRASTATTSKDGKRIFTFRGSLGRALGKKMRRDISSPLVDDDTYRRLENNHKIVDMKNLTTLSSAV